MEASPRSFRTHSPAGTEGLAELVGRQVPAGTVLALVGEMGAGKTVFARGLARGLGIAASVSSPTFVLMQEYDGGRLPLYHFDAWMEGRERMFLEGGGAEYLESEGVALVEWAGRVESFLPAPRIEVQLDPWVPATPPEGIPGSPPDGPPEERRLTLRCIAAPTGSAQGILAREQALHTLLAALPGEGPDWVAEKSP